MVSRWLQGSTSLVCHTASSAVIVECFHKSSVSWYSNRHFYIHQTDWTSSLNLTDIPWIVPVVVHLSLQISSSWFNCTWFLNYFIFIGGKSKKYSSATWLYSVDFYAWYFDLSCGLFSSMILHCDDGNGIRQVEAVLEEPTNRRPMCRYSKYRNPFT